MDQHAAASAGSECHSPVDAQAAKLLVVAQQRGQVGSVIHEHQELVGVDERCARVRLKGRRARGC